MRFEKINAYILAGREAQGAGLSAGDIMSKQSEFQSCRRKKSDSSNIVLSPLERKCNMLYQREPDKLNFMKFILIGIQFI